ncbi:hypothetical protein [Azospirillum sp. ST 5-10]|uniref:hypothetical protein n=1 Tax=unclassified Azospirillum TaxID=2630922 RepID=UPI003F49EAC5
MATLNPVLYALTAVFFILALRDAPKRATARRGSVWFLTALSLFVGMVTANVFQPSAAMLLAQIVTSLSVALIGFFALDHRLRRSDTRSFGDD